MHPTLYCFSYFVMGTKSALNLKKKFFLHGPQPTASPLHLQMGNRSEYYSISYENKGRP